MKQILLITVLLLTVNVLFAQKNYYKITIDSLNVQLLNDTVITLSKGQIYESPKENHIILFGDTIPVSPNGIEKGKNVFSLSAATLAYLQKQSKYLDIPTSTFNFEGLKDNNGGHNISLIFEKGKYEKDLVDSKNGISFDLSKTVKKNVDFKNKDIHYLRIISGNDTPVFCLSPFSTKSPFTVAVNQPILSTNGQPDKDSNTPITFMEKMEIGIKDYGIHLLVALLLVALAVVGYRSTVEKQNRTTR